MTAGAPSARFLYAAVPADDAKLARSVGRGLAVVVAGAAAAVVGPRPPETADPFALALAHDRVMQRLLARCSSVLPFRLGMVAPPTDDLRRLLHSNAAALGRHLARFHDRVEMGLKIKAPAVDATFELGPVHELVTAAEDRIERVVERRGAALFDGVYLVARPRIDEFWAAVERIRDAAPGRPVVGVGPFAPYSFCDLPIEATGVA